MRTIVAMLLGAAGIAAGAEFQGLAPELGACAETILLGTNDAARAGALDALDRMGAGALPLVPLLIARLADDPSPRWPEEESRAVLALAAIGDPAVESLLRAVENPAQPGRAGAIRALGRTKHEHALSRLAALARDADPVLRRSATWALGKTDHEAAAAALQEALGHADSETRCLAAWGLGRTGGEGARTALTAALRDADPGVRAAAAASLGTRRLRTPRSLESLRALLQDPDAGVARAVARAVRSIEASPEFRRAAARDAGSAPGEEAACP